MINAESQESNFNIKNVYNWLFLEQSCQLCSKPNKHAICDDCFASLPFNIYACPHCAHPTMPGELCKVCVSHAFYFDDAIAAFIYQGNIKTAIKHIKFHSDFSALDLLLSPIKQRITIKPDALVYVPSHPTRQRQRGYNQSQILALKLSRYLNIPIFNGCTRNTYTAPVAHQTKKQREALLRDTFICHASPPEHVAIIDDVLTTCATANALAKELRKQGAKRISVWAIARTAKD